MRELAGQMAFTNAAESADARFSELVSRQSRFVFRVAWSLLRNVHDAEDVVQETFLRVHRAGAWDKMDSERAFLATTAWRLAADRLRRGKRETEITGDVASRAQGPEDALVSADWNATVARLVDGLPEEMRQPLVLSGVDGLTSREIAVVMGIAEGTVRTRLMRAREILKGKLAGLMEKRHG